VPDELSLNVKTDESDHKIGSAIGNRFVLLEALGKGTYGSVYRATDKNLEKEVAVKILHYHLLQDSSAVTRFLKEAQSSCRLQHENVIATYAIGQAEDQAPFIVMELGSGITLKDWLLSNKPTFDQILIILRGMTAGLAAAHAQRVVHRDLKPSNVMIAEVNGTPRAKVLDFGIAKVLSISHEQRLTQTGAMLGTPAYMSPEVCTGKNVDERSDLYSLGCILYEMCTGETPFKGGSALDTMGKQLRDSPAPLPPGTPTAFQTLIDRLMAKNPDQRIQCHSSQLPEVETGQ
jgi:eukaryotic-like serine/threonine-protein kinase